MLRHHKNWGHYPSCQKCGWRGVGVQKEEKSVKGENDQTVRIIFTA